MSVQELAPLIDQMSPQELDELEAHLKEVRARLRDEQIERDAKNGKLDALAEKAKANFAAGRFQEI